MHRLIMDVIADPHGDRSTPIIQTQPQTRLAHYKRPELQKILTAVHRARIRLRKPTGELAIHKAREAPNISTTGPRLAIPR